MPQKHNEVIFFRAALGVYFLYYYASLLPDFLTFFGPEGMFRPHLHFDPGPSLFFLWGGSFFVFLLLALLAVSLIFFTLGFYPKIFLGPIFLIHLSFHHANPLILHEPQPLANLLLLISFFLPLDGKVNDADSGRVVRLLLLFLGVYYFAAGFKKLPDPLWLEGEALRLILAWPPLGRDNLPVRFLTDQAWAAAILNYLTLVFELSFVFLIFTRFKRWLFLAAGVFQLMIYVTLEVGSFPFLMLAWQTLLLEVPVPKVPGSNTPCTP